MLQSLSSKMQFKLNKFHNYGRDLHQEKLRLFAVESSFFAIDLARFLLQQLA